MDFEINPKLLDVVQFEDSLAKGGKLKGTIVDTLGNTTPHSFLIEVSDEKGVPLGLFTRRAEELTTVWRSKPESGGSTVPEAQRLFENGFLLLQNGLIDSAKEQLSKAFALEPRLAGYLLNATKSLVEGKSFDAAIVVCKMLLEILPSYDLARENLARTYVNRGVEFARRGLLGKAVEDFDCGLMLRPSEAVVEGIRRNTASVYGNLGVLYSEMKQYEQALQLFQWSLELYPSEVARKNVALAQIAVSAKAKMRAPDEETFRQAMLVGLTRSECLNAYGAALAGLGQLTEARRVLESAIQANPHNEVARRNLTALSSRDEGLVFALGVIRQEIQSPHQHSG